MYDNSFASGTPLFTDTEPLSGGSATSKGYTTTAPGPEFWVATYNGDSYNTPVSSGDADEPVSVTPATESYDQTVLGDNPVAFWKLNESPGSMTAADSSGNNNDGTYSGAVSLGDTGPFSGDTAALFNTPGNSGQVSVPNSSSLQTDDSF